MQGKWFDRKIFVVFPCNHIYLYVIKDEIELHLKILVTMIATASREFDSEIKKKSVFTLNRRRKKRNFGWEKFPEQRHKIVCNIYNIPLENSRTCRSNSEFEIRNKITYYTNKTKFSFTMIINLKRYYYTRCIKR